MDAKLIGGVGIGVIISLVLGFFIIPTELTIERALLVQAEPEAVYPHLVDLAAWETWEPWGTDVVGGESGAPTAGVGARRGWPGGGELRVDEVERDIVVRYSVAGPAQPSNGAVELKTHAEGTVVVWTHYTQTGYLPSERLAGWTARATLALQIDAALAGLKQAAEAPH